jgi:hypothetical protein
MNNKRRRFSRSEQLEDRRVLAAGVVINEIHYNPAGSQTLSEFVELFNAGEASVDVSGWAFSDGISYQFPANTVLEPGGYYLIAESAEEFNREFNLGAGPFVAFRVPEGERGRQNFGGSLGMDFNVHEPIRVTSLGAFDSAGDGFGRDIHVQLWQRDDGGSPNAAADDRGIRVLAEHTFTADSPGELDGGSRFHSLDTPLALEPGSYTIVASGYGVGERVLNGGGAGVGSFSNVGGRITLAGSSRWSDAPSSFPQNVDAHPHQYGAGSFRFDFTAQQAFQPADGQYTGKLSNSGETIMLRDANGAIVDTVSYQTSFPWPTAAGGAGPSMELIHPSLDNDLGGSWRSAGDGPLGLPSPGRENSVFARNAPPQVRQVATSPEMPTSGQSVLITAKVTDPDGVSQVTAAYQVVAPGEYITRSDERYATQWTTLVMSDDGTGGDRTAGDDVYSVTLPGELHAHRHLIRYRITVSDLFGTSIQTPYADDAQSNFAYFVYDGIPAWTAADRPGHTEPVTYGTDVMRSLPAFHLLSLESDVVASNYNTSFNTNEFRFEGTLVVGNHVYDHIRYRIRGQNSTYVTGKNKWKLKFNQGHEFQGYDQAGNPWPERLGTLNFGTAASPWAPANRGLAGMDEAIAFRLFNMAGVAAPNISPFQLRVIDSVDEAMADNQYEGDLWGLYLAFENPSGDFLRAHDLPDGNLFRMQNTASELEHHGYGLPGDLSDLNAFTSSRTGYNVRPNQPISWWRDNVDLDGYYSYRSIVEAINHSDIRDVENMLLYFNRETQRWSMLPWDVDLLFEEFDRWGPQGVQNASILEQFRKALIHEELLIEFQNRARELQDLLLNADQGAQVVEEYARYVEPFAAIDRAMWDYNPRASRAPANRQHLGAFYNETYRYPSGNGAAGQVRRAIDPVGFEGMVNWVKEFIAPDGFGGGRLAQMIDDPQIPLTPTATAIGEIGFPTNDLTFRASEFQDPQGQETVAAIEWRLGRVSNPNTRDYVPGNRWIYELDQVWSAGGTAPFETQVRVPATAVTIGHSYRLRVRYQDATGRWSHWSSPVEFTTGSPQTSADIGLRISEIHYHPAPPSAGEIQAGFDNANDFEFLELQNISDQPVDLTRVELRRTENGEGVSFAFAEGTIQQLMPNERVVVVEDIDAFQLRYGSQLAVAGQWTGQLANGGETLRLVVDAVPMLEFAYDDAWFPATDGGGYSLELTDPLVDRSLLGTRAAWQSSSRLGGTPASSSVRVVGDVNGDGVFDSRDLVLLFQAATYADEQTGDAGFLAGDFDGDRKFTSRDLVLLFQQTRYTD